MNGAIAAIGVLFTVIVLAAMGWWMFGHLVCALYRRADQGPIELVKAYRFRTVEMSQPHDEQKAIAAEQRARRVDRKIRKLAASRAVLRRRTRKPLAMPTRKSA